MVGHLEDQLLIVHHHREAGNCSYLAVRSEAAPEFNEDFDHAAPEGNVSPAAPTTARRSPS